MSDDDREREDWLEFGMLTEALVKKYPVFFRSNTNLTYHYRRREKNGLAERDAVRKLADGKLFWHEKRTLDWALQRPAS